MKDIPPLPINVLAHISNIVNKESRRLTTLTSCVMHGNVGSKKCGFHVQY